MSVAAVERTARRRGAHAERPSIPGGLISRSRLVRRLAAARDVPVVMLVAPAGYGKTALLSEWAASSSQRFAWVTPEDDARRLGRSINTALLDARVLVIDGLEKVRAPETMGMLSEVIDELPAGARVVIASRGEPALGLGGLRAKRRLFELHAADLAMSVGEASALLATHGLALERQELEALVRRTEGWPAALYLATLAARQERDPQLALATFSGDDRFVADYIAEELFAPLDRQELTFLARSSVIERLSGPMCDFVLERSDSARMLKRLSRKNVMLVPLDRSDDEYRYHRLFAQALQAELRRSEPSLGLELHARASAWYADHADVERSIGHAVAAGDADRAGELLWDRAADLLGYGRTAQLGRWLSSFSDAQVAASPALALTAAAQALMAGERNLVEHWTALAMDGSRAKRNGALRSSAQLLRATVAEDGVTRMGELAESAAGDLQEESPWLALGCLLQGVAGHLAGERERARSLLEEGARRAAARSPILQALCLAQLSLLALERHDSAAAEALAARAKAQVERSGVDDYPTAALVLAVSAAVEARLGRVEASKADVREATRLLALLADFAPWYEAECHLALARATLRLGDSRQAQQHLDDAEAQLGRAPDARVAVAWVAECRSHAERSSASSAERDWALTTAELRVLQFLPTHLSFPDIAERLYVSANTVKTHARSVYRKLEASSRGEAVVRAREAGLLDQASHAGVGHEALGALS
jgi:LuxR family maltose regulon positive regulatory protein